jgi:hypothetical protein
VSLLDQLLQLPLFGDAPVAPAIPEKVRRDTGPGGWELVDHACQHCLGRVLVRRRRGITVEARCAECGAHSSEGIAGVCCCGAECGTVGHVLECFRNPTVSPSLPQEVLVRERPTVERRADPRRSKPVGSKDF